MLTPDSSLTRRPKPARLVFGDEGGEVPDLAQEGAVPTARPHSWRKLAEPRWRTRDWTRAVPYIAEWKRIPEASERRG